MVKKNIDLDKITNGMKLAQDVFDERGQLLLPKEIELTFDMIRKIRSVSRYNQLSVYVEKSEIELLVEKYNREKSQPKISKEKPQAKISVVKIERNRDQQKVRKQIAVMEEWNGLSNQVVSAKTTQSFKRRLG